MVPNDPPPAGERSLPPLARLLGFAGLLPQLAAAGVVTVMPREATFAAQALGFAYASLILSFLGGLWWGMAAARRDAPGWIYVAAVAPSLFALACAIPWAVGWSWPGPSLVALALAIWASLLIDMRLVKAGLAPGWWMRLRFPLSLVLGGLTLIVALAA